MKENSDLVSIDVAKLARKKGFDGISSFAYCFDIGKNAYYISYDALYFRNSELFAMHAVAPSREQLAAWLRNKNVFINLDVDQTHEPKFTYEIKQFVLHENGMKEWISCPAENGMNTSDLFYTYEKALEEALMIALNTLPNKD